MAQAGVEEPSSNSSDANDLEEGPESEDSAAGAPASVGEREGESASGQRDPGSESAAGAAGEGEGEEAPAADEEPDAAEDEDQAGEAPEPTALPGTIRYVIEDIRVEGAGGTRDYVVLRFVPLEVGDVLDVDDPRVESIRWRLLGTGFFDTVDLQLERGSRRGLVRLVIRVTERNTILVQRLTTGLSQGVARSTDTRSDLLPYLGVSVAETNLLGFGMELSLSGLVSRRQQGVELGFVDPAFLASDVQVGATAFFTDALEFFGQDPLVAVECPMPTDPEDECPPEVEARNAVVFYRRFGGGLGFGLDITDNTSLQTDWFGEVLDVGVRPDAASESRGTDVDPIDFAIEDGLSFVSTLRVGLRYDRRDDPAVPNEGVLLRLNGMLGTRLIGSDYSFFKLEGLVRHWVPLPGAHHRLRFTAYAGAIFGDAPFFHRFYVADLSDLIPSRVLLMNIDDRTAPNLLNTSIAEMRSQELAARLDVEYSIRLYEGGGSFRALEVYGLVGIYGLANRRDLDFAIPGYEGFSKAPLDLTFDIGVRADTAVGVFQLGFSSLLGFVPVFDQ